MHVYFHIFGLDIPAYGTMIVLGVVIANVLALYITRRDDRAIDDLILLEAYAALGGFIGAKILYVIVSYREIDFHRIKDITYVNSIIKGGFVFYGGLIGGFFAILLAKKLHHIDLKYYAENYVFLVPFCHGFGRIGCFLAGCCYGMRYDGPFSVVFPQHSFAEPGVPLFPVQIVEAFGLFFIAGVLFFLSRKMHTIFSVEFYILMYGILRFLLEFFRADEARGVFKSLSTSQWLSIILVIGSLISIVVRKKMHLSVSDRTEPR